MRDALHVQVVITVRHVVKQDDGGLAGGEVLLQRQDLPPIPQRVAGHQAQLRQRIEHHAARLEPIDVFED